MSQKAGKIEVQEDKGNGEHQLRDAQVVADKTNCYNKNQTNGQAVDDKGKDSDLRKSKNGFDARCMEIKSGSRYSGNPGNQLIFANPKQNDAKQEIIKTEELQTVESLQMIQQMFPVSYFNNKQHQMLKLMLLIGIYSNTSISWHCLKRQ